MTTPPARTGQAMIYGYCAKHGVYERCYLKTAIRGTRRHTWSRLACQFDWIWWML